MYYTLRKNKGIFSPSATYFIAEDSTRISVHFNNGMYNNNHTNWILPALWNIHVYIFYRYLISMQQHQTPPLNKTKFENFHLVIKYSVESAMFQNVCVRTRSAVDEPLSSINLLKPAGYGMNKQAEYFNNCTLCPYCIYEFGICLRTNSDLCQLYKKLIGFYNRDVKCLQSGTDWAFK
jgi:hypothetical protein